MRSRNGFTLLEALVALTLAAGVIAAALTMLRLQVRAFTVGADRAEVTMTAQFATTTLSRELRTAGTNVLPHQPWLVYAGADAVAFHADLVSRTTDPFAVYIDPDAGAGEVMSLRQSERYTLPRTSFAYPDTTYWAAPTVAGSAELVIFYFEPDTTTARTDDHLLMRRINAAAPEVVASRILRTGTTPFFEYYRTVRGGDDYPVYAAIPSTSLPLAHRVPLHLSPGDTGALALVDSVHAVRFSFTVTNGYTGDEERRLQRSDFVWLRNGGLARQRTCGSSPIFDSNVSVSVQTIAGAPAVRVRWDAATDETGGEEDVIRYVVWRTVPGQTGGDPLLSMPAGASSYEYLDTSVQPGEAWTYSVAAQDCTPNLSTVRGSAPITVQ